jgi:tetratricopeptide (TPR) repeat protein
MSRSSKSATAPRSALSARPVTHAAFFEALGALPDGGGSRWADLLAGLVTLRLVDRWARHETSSLSRTALHAVEQAISGVDAHTSLRPALHEIVDAVRASLRHTDTDVLSAVLAYGHSLRLNADWALAADAYQTVIVAARALSDQRLVPEAYDRIGYCWRMLGELDRALEAYAAGRAIAEEAGDTAMALRIRVSEANVAIGRGNFPGAELLLEEVVSAAYAANLPSVAALALHDRGLVAHVRGHLERGILFYHDALIHATDPGQRDRLLADLGRAFGELGARDVAREALLLLYVTGSAQVDRWVAAINLLELAALDAQETVFEEYRRELAQADLPPRYQAFYHLFVGEGCARFRRMKCALTSFQRAIKVAEQYEVNEVLVRAEAGRDAAQRHRATPPYSAPVEVPEAIAHVASALRILREQTAAAHS